MLFYIIKRGKVQKRECQALLGSLLDTLAAHTTTLRTLKSHQKWQKWHFSILITA
jgi:hypothetical protein